MIRWTTRETIRSKTIVALIVPALVATIWAPSGALAQSVTAHDPWGTLRSAEPTADNEPAPEADLPADIPEPDWTLLTSSLSPSGMLTPRNGKAPAPGAGTSWTSQNKSDGSAALSVKQPLLPFWDTRVGADINVAQPTQVLTTSDMLRQKFGTDAPPLSQSNGTAWAAMTAPGVGSIWDRTAIEARIDPSQDQGRFGTSLSKSVPLSGNQYSLTLQNGLNVIQQNAIPTIGYNGRPTRSYEADQSAKLSIADTGTSLVAGQTLSTTDEKWMRKVGAEQKLFGGVNISASVSETLQGPANKSLTAGFKHSW